MNKGWGGNLIIGTLVETTVTNDNEQKESADNSAVDEENKTERSKSTKSKKNVPQPTENIRVTLPYKPKGEMFAVAETFQGGSRLQLICCLLYTSDAADDLSV